MVLKSLKGLLGLGSKTNDPVSYDKAKNLLEKGSEKQRLNLASHKDTTPEVLYYLADDASAGVRKQIARNPSTPIQADAALVSDEDEEVRGELARKIARLVPGLNPDEQSTLRDSTIEILEKLASDQLPKIRAIIAEEIKKSDAVPKHIVSQLARDIEDIVSAPILEYSPLLNDDDLREIIAAGSSQSALIAIASREGVSGDVSDDLAATLEIPAVAALLTNQSAQIREDTLDQIINQAKKVKDLHRPLAVRGELSVRAMKRISSFVASALVHRMMEKNPLEEEQAEELLDRVRDRLANERLGEKEESVLALKAKEFYSQGRLDDSFIKKQIEKGSREFVLQCLALLADIPVKAVRQVIHSKSGRAVTALSWKAQLKMRTAYEIQTKLALVPNGQLLPAKNGTSYPISEDELEWHLSYFLE